MTEQNSPVAVGRVLASTIAIAIETNPSAWTRPWSVTGEATPHNPITHEIYRGVNRLVLSHAAYAEERTVGAWATKRQWRRAGTEVGSRSTGVTIVVPSDAPCCDVPACDDQCGNAASRMFRTSTVFHHHDTGGDHTTPTHPRFRTAPPALTADQISEMFAGLGATIKTGSQPFYSTAADRITMPTAAMMPSLDHWVSILTQEHIHWTGHPSRLNRRVKNAPTRQRALQRLVGEFGGLLLTNSLGLHYYPGSENQSRRHSWVSQLRGQTGGQIISETVASACAAAQMIMSGLSVPTSQAAREQPTASDQDQPDSPPPLAKSKPRTNKPRRQRPRVTLFARKTHSQCPLVPTALEPNPGTEPVPTEVETPGTAPGGQATEDDRRRVAGWVMERVAEDNGNHEIASQTIGGLLDLPAGQCQRPPTGAPAHALKDERLRVAKWMLGRVIADHADHSEGARHIGHLLGIAPEEIQTPHNDRTPHR